MKFKVGDMVKMSNSPCDCESCEEACSSYHKVLGIEEHYGEDCVLLQGLDSFFPIHIADWSIKPQTLENK